MPPNSTQNLNAKLSLTAVSSQRSDASRPTLSPPPIQSSAPSTKIVGGPRQYRGGYYLNV